MTLLLRHCCHSDDAATTACSTLYAASMQHAVRC